MRIKSLPLRAFLKRAVRASNVSVKPFLQADDPPSPVPHLPDHASALGAANLLATVKHVNVADRLKQVGYESVPHHLLPEQGIWQQMEHENNAAAAVNRVAFTYVDLTSKEVLPLWIAPDAVGGRAVLP
eukprot:5907800-Amphidinium_carterae.1